MNSVQPWLTLVLAALATWRVTHLIAEEDGPADLMLKARSRLGTSMLGSLMDCFQCVSLWVAIPFAFALASSPWQGGLAWLALSGAACLLERTGNGATPLSADLLTFPESHEHDLLRPRQNPPAR